MTRRGSIAYYLAAVVCGSFFFTLAQFLIGRVSDGASDWAWAFLSAFFLETMFGCAPQLLSAFVLRRLAGPLHWTNPWHWAVGGAGVFLMVLIALGLLGAGFDRIAGGWRFASYGMLLFRQAAESLHGGVWQALAAGAPTALVLYSVNRAFGREETVQQKAV